MQWINVNNYYHQFQCALLMITCCSHDLEATNILPNAIDGMSNNIWGTPAAPRLPFCSMADETIIIILHQCVPGAGSSVTLGCAPGWILHWHCHGKHY